MNFTCINCGDAISNPICTECLNKQLQQWAHEKKIKIFTTVESKGNTGVKCIKCEKEMQICSHCFVKDVFEEIKSQKPNLTEEFLINFNFSLREPPQLLF